MGVTSPPHAPPGDLPPGWEPLPGASVDAARAVLAGAASSLPATTIPLASDVAVLGPDRRWSGRLTLDRASWSAAARLPEAAWLWSVSKLALAAAAHRLADLGLLDRDRPLVRWAPWAPVANGVTLAHLLAHTGGVPDYGGWPEYHAAVRDRPGDPWPPDDYLRRAARLGPVASPGERFAYSNIGYLVVRRVVEEVTGQDLAAALRELVVAPLGLAETGVSLRPGDCGALVPAPDPADPTRDVTATYHPGWVSHGTLVSTARDAATLAAGVIDGDLLSPGSRARLARPAVPVATGTPYGDLWWGEGALVGRGEDGDVVGHTGAGPGSSTAALVVRPPGGPAIAVGVVVNREGDQLAGRVAMAVARAMAARPGI
jgi:D-alanyl-D-alanine carboxypeptidase